MFIEFKKIKVVLCFVDSIKMFRFIVVFFEYYDVFKKIIFKNKKLIVGRVLLIVILSKIK